MHAPWFWSRRLNPLSLFFYPFGWLYYFGSRLRTYFAKPFQANIPVCCVGNVTMGGVGKTPVVIALVEELQQQGFKPCCLSKGYGGKLRGPIQVDLGHHTANEVGDEALLLAQHTPTWIAHHRIDGIKAIAQEKAYNIVIMDDGLQNPTVHKDYSILVIDRKIGLGNGYLFPAGPLREPLSRGLKKANAVIEMGKEEFWSIQHSSSLPIFSACLQGGVAADYPKGYYLAFAGIGYPEKFFCTLKDQGFDIADTISFADHHSYTVKDIEFLKTLAKKHQAYLITTEKDWVRLNPKDQQAIIPYPVTLIWSGDSVVDSLLKCTL